MSKRTAVSAMNYPSGGAAPFERETVGGSAESRQEMLAPRPELP